MFDWNDEELTNIIWDEAEDHIVPYPVGSEAYSKNKDWTHEASSSKLEEQKKAPSTKDDISGRKQESASNVKNNEGTSCTGYQMDPWPDISLPKVSKKDQDCLETSVSSLRETAKPGKDLQTFQTLDESKEQADFVDYGWANIGSFDDLDRIFSNDDSIFGNVNLDNADELWSSSKEVASNPENSFPLSTGSPSLKLGIPASTADHYGLKTEYAQEEEQTLMSSRVEVNDHTSTLQNAHAMISSVEYGGDGSKVTINEADSNAQGRNSSVNSQITVEDAALQSGFTNKVCKQSKKSKGRKKMVGKNDMMIYPAAYHNWNTSGNPSGRLKNQLIAPSSSILRQQRQPRGSEPLQYHQVNSPFRASFRYANVNLTNPCSSMPVPVQSAEFKHQSLLPGHNALLGNQASVKKLASTAVKGKSMTPQEKIEKLRRRQQMRAMLAIQKQQQQFDHQTPSKDHSFNKRAWEETQVQHSSGADAGVEDPSTLLDFEQDDSSTVSLPAKECGMEESVLFQLQDIIAKLDVRIRLCIRDSLFRLAQSSMHRNSTSNNSSTNISCKDKKPPSMQKASCPDRNAVILEEETKTNPIDRIVAHLLFHRPQEPPGKHPGTPESPASSKYTLECEGEGSSKHKASFLSETEMDKQNVTDAVSRISCLSSDPMAIGQQSQNVLSSETSENVSNCRPADELTQEAETSI